MTINTYEKLKQMIPENHQYIRLVDHTVLQGKNHLEKLIDDVIKLRGEGVVLRNPESRYVGGFTKNMYKFRVRISVIVLLFIFLT